MELSALVGAPQGAPPNVPADDGDEGMSSVTDETIDTFLRELQADLAEASQPTSTTPSTNSNCRRPMRCHNIAAANPLLAGKEKSYF